MKIALLAGCLLVLILCAPIALIWAVNLLFGLAIPYTVKTWVAVIVLTSIFGRTTVEAKR